MIETGDVLVAEVHTLAGEYVNASIVEQGFARWNVSKAPNDARLTEAQNVAVSGMLGVWNPAIQKIAEEIQEEGVEAPLVEKAVEE